VIEKSILLILPAENFNEQEYLLVKNAFEKSHYKIFIASDSYALCTGGSGMKVRADVSFYNMHENNFAAVVFIGGSGVKNYWDNPTLHLIAESFNKNRKPVAAICSAPVILAKAGLLSNIEATCYPADKKMLENGGCIFKDAPVVAAKNIITANGPAAAVEFTHAVIGHIVKRFSSV